MALLRAAEASVSQSESAQGRRSTTPHTYQHRTLALIFRARPVCIYAPVHMCILTLYTGNGNGDGMRLKLACCCVVYRTTERFYFGWKDGKQIYERETGRLPQEFTSDGWIDRYAMHAEPPMHGLVL